MPAPSSNNQNNDTKNLTDGGNNAANTDGGNSGNNGHTELDPINNDETIPAPPSYSDPDLPTPEVTFTPAPSYTDDSYHPSDNGSAGGSSSTPTGSYSGYSGGYTVNYNTEPAYYPAPSSPATGTGSAKKISLKITARTDSKGNVTLEWEKVRKADKYTV